jgi:hypothetical protein
MVGSPGEARLKQLDQRCPTDLRQIQSAVDLGPARRPRDASVEELREDLARERHDKGEACGGTCENGLRRICDYSPSVGT